MRKKFDEQIEMQIVQDRLSGATIREIETKYGCNKKYVQRLMKRHSQQGDIQKGDNQGDNEKTGTSTEADARAQGTTPDDKQAAEQRPVIIVQAARDLRCYSSYKDKCRIAKEAINQILNELEFSQWTIDNINSLFDNATRSQRPQLEISQEDTKEFFGFDGTYTDLQEYFRNKMESAWLAEVS